MNYTQIRQRSANSTRPSAPDRSLPGGLFAGRAMEAPQRLQEGMGYDEGERFSFPVGSENAGTRAPVVRASFIGERARRASGDGGGREAPLRACSAAARHP